jgi:hypothetical protein
MKWVRQAAAEFEKVVKKLREHLSGRNDQV